MTPDIEVAVDFALAQSGKSYCLHRPISEYASCYDCSALVIASLIHMYHQAGKQPPADLLACSNTVDLYKWGQQHGYLVSVAKGAATRGAIMIRGRSYGFGPLGHTSYSLGDGNEMAAHGFRSGIHPSVLDTSFYQDALIINDGSVHYAALDPPVDPKVLAAIAKLLKWEQAVTLAPLHQGDTTNNVSILNDLLIHRGLMDRKYKSNTYTQNTRAAVHRLKLDKGIDPPDGRGFGGTAAKALLAPPAH